MKGKFKKSSVQIIIACTVGVLVAVLFRAGLFKGFEYFLEDRLLSPQGNASGIVIITIDDESISKIGQWPWPREEYAKLLNALAKYPPKVIGFDIVFSEASRMGPADDAKFTKAVSHHGLNGIILASESDTIKPLPQFLGPRTESGDVHLLVDFDGVVREVTFKGSFAQKIAESVSEYATANDGEQWRADNSLVGARIAWTGTPGTFRRVPFWRLLNDSDGELAKSLADRIVLVGATATDLHDEQLTAIEPGQAMPGVEIQANLANMLLSHTGYRELPAVINFAFVLLSALVIALCFVFISRMLWSIIASLLFLILLVIVMTLGWEQGFVMLVLHPLLSGFLSLISQILFRYFGTESSKREMRALFGKYVSRDILDEILRDPSKVKLGGEEREVTILFSDVRGFTTFSEAMTPTELTTFLNRYLTKMTDIILENKGVVDKYIGDAIMAFWGAPVNNVRHALDALRSAVIMSEALNEFNHKSENMGARKIDIGIGLNSGNVVAGNMGSNLRFDYTLMGDAVNLASRLESLTRQYGVRILVSGDVIKRVDLQSLEKEKISVREIDKAKVKGKTESVIFYEIITPTNFTEFKKIEEEFARARELYYVGKWQECLNTCEEVLKNKTNDGPTLVFKSRCLEFMSSPPQDWSGVYEHKSKS